MCTLELESSTLESIARSIVHINYFLFTQNTQTPTHMHKLMHMHTHVQEHPCTHTHTCMQYLIYTHIVLLTMHEHLCIPGTKTNDSDKLLYHYVYTDTLETARRTEHKFRSQKRSASYSTVLLFDVLCSLQNP